MFSRVIGFFEILFGLWKIVLIYGTLKKPLNLFNFILEFK